MDIQTERKVTACALCGSSFPGLAEQRSHFRSDWHGYNLKRKHHSLPTVDEASFEKIVEHLDESISGSESSGSEDEHPSAGSGSSMLSQLLQKQALLQDGDDAGDSMTVKKKRGAGAAPMLWFSSPLLPPSTFLGVYRALFTSTELEEPNLVGALQKRQLEPQKVQVNGATQASSGPTIFLCMIGGGHFAGMIVSLIPKC